MKDRLIVVHDEFGDIRVGDFDLVAIDNPRYAKAIDPQIEKITTLRLIETDATRDKETWWEAIGIVFQRIKKPKSSV